MILLPGLVLRGGLVAAFIASLPAAFFLMAINYLSVGRIRKALKSTSRRSKSLV